MIQKKIEPKVLKEQNKNLPKAIGDKIEKLWRLSEEQTTPVGKLAYEADILETAMQAKEYYDLGYNTKDWLTNVKKKLVSKSAKKLFKQLETTRFDDWWEGLKKI